MAKKGRKMIIRVVHPKMKKYLEDHPYMEPDGMQEGKGASREYCESTPCKDMGFTQKASCKSQGAKDCYRGKKKTIRLRKAKK